ncbi:hypothetical protein F5Y08DRAFT_303741 [Xylaria arbuscula]|nr:hypothetical protein F5Y08DRAFT_303741 [Xylaria arbuscula]
MDPATIVQIVGTAVSLGDVVIKCIAGLRTLKSKYHDAPLIISTIIGQLYMVQAALDQLAKWNRPERDRDPRYQQLAQQIDNSIDCFGPLVTSLEQRLKDFELTNENDITTTQRLAFLWNEQETSDFSVLLDRQVNAFNLLLQAVQCNTLAQQQDLLLREQSQSILQQAKDCSSSIVGVEDCSSFVSENSAGISLAFDFDSIILASKIYQKAGRSHLRQAIKAHNQASPQDKFEEIPGQTYSELVETCRQTFHSDNFPFDNAVRGPVTRRDRPALKVNNMPVIPKSLRMGRRMSHRKTSLEKRNRPAGAWDWESAPKTKVLLMYKKG